MQVQICWFSRFVSYKSKKIQAQHQMKELKNTPAIIRATFSLKSRQYLTPHFIRILLTGPDLHRFAHLIPGANNKIFIPGASGSNEMIRRTYTFRSIDMEKKEMAIDFVAHGDEGPASAWAIQAKEGDLLEVAMKDKTTPLYPPTDWYLLAGDHTALPVISVILETLPAEAEGTAILHVASEEDILPIQTASKVKIKWIFGTPHHFDALLEAVSNIIIPTEKTKYAFVAAESSVVSNLRNYFNEVGLQRAEVSAYAYWKKGVAEDKSQSERQNERAAG